MTTHFTTYIDLPAPAKDLNALLDHLAGVNPEEAFIDAVVSKDGTRLEVSYTSEDLTKTSTGVHLHFEAGEYITKPGAPVTTKIDPPRDHLGRFTKRK